METEGSEVKIDKNLIKRLRDFNISFMTRSEEHMQYFGSIYTGVYQAKFKTSDRDLWFDTVIENIDERSAYSRIVKLPTLKPEWRRATDIMNMTCLWLTHRFLTDEKLSTAEKQEGALQALLILNIKFLTSITSAYFSYPVNIDVARAVVDKMNNKYLLKQLGSWSGFIQYRCNEIKKSSSSNYKAIINFDDDEDIIIAVHDIQLRFRQTIKTIYKVLNEVMASHKKVNVISNSITLEGEQVLRDITKNETQYLRYIHTVLQDKTRFIKDELIDVVVNISPTMNPRFFKETLSYLQQHYNIKNTDITDLVDETVLHSIEYLRRSPETRKLIHDIGGLATRLRANYSSSTSTDASLLKMRETGGTVVSKASGIKNPVQISAVRTGVFIYLVLRTYSMKHYK
jgi:hypothetical protein